ncbi:T9SS type B sorting domain-containing protein [Flavobacterium sp. MR2016-29]|uniref:T9SS type B sorting domain-containing protein n=1 Tax=Flavobacterium sp. MR2016-29 TaxID=2783795 RepID=UPI00188B8ECD|nr:T9SS type B sorting domain-containing protein [Flavobacterium sp. MR2016-29]MBF4493622.1 T9SS type B sorting domain-containing protein [Flavobacterium sp. MR2016-29]
MRATLFLLLLFYSTISLSQGIVVDTTTLTIPELIREELMQNACANENNFKFSSHLGIGKFTSTNPNFPISEGIIIRNGIAKYTEGNYTGNNESSQLNTANDSDLQVISDSNGQIVPITDVSFVQFDFTPLSSNFSFEFLFASNEYGEFQCGFSDVFAFILTDLTTGTTTNLAVVPGTNTPVSVKNIRDQQYNSSCLSANANLFDHYNVNNPANSAINMRGETKVLMASSTVIPNRTYSIKLAIGDYNDSNYDSAVFIKGGSFMTNMDLGPDRNICQGEKITLQSGLIGNYTYIWTLNGTVIPGETSSSLTLDKAGTYGVTATLSGCVIKDEVVISDLAIKPPKNLIACYTENGIYQYDLTQNNATVLGVNPAEYSLYYFASLTAANANGPIIPENQLNSFTSSGNQTIYIKAVPVNNRNTFCNNLISFDLLVTAPINVVKPPDLSVCDTNSGRVRVDLTVQEPAILNGLNPSDYKIIYYTSQTDANNGRNSIPNPTVFITSLAQSPQTIWVRVQNISSSVCYTIVNFDIIINSLPNVDALPDVIACNSYTLPPITFGNYYTGPSGTGTKLNAGDVITKTGVYYIYSGSTSNNCTNENYFNVTLVYELSFAKEACGAYIVPRVAAGGFFTEPGGRGDPIPNGTLFTTDQTIYYYAVFNGSVCRDEAVPFIVHPLPPIDKPSNVVTCDSYTLPSLVNGNYYTAAGGGGTLLNAGTNITSSRTLFVFANDGRCTNEHSFKIDIVDSSIFVPITQCGSYTLPAVEIGGYYDSPGGQGKNIPSETIITTSQTVYYYVATTTSNNCTNNLKYDITIKPLPLVDMPSNRLECKSYILPPLINGNYFTGTNGGGNSLKAGDIITSTQTIYVYSVGTECNNEHSFIVEIRKLPPVDSFTDVVTCADFKLPVLKNGQYYTATGGPNGLGTQIAEGTSIKTTQTVYIYNEWPDFKTCTNETFFKINANGIDVGTFENINVCDSYTLPPLNLGNYFSQPGGKGPIIPAGTVLTSSQTIYVYAIVGTRSTCTSEKSFSVTISITPILVSTPDVAICESYTLPPLPIRSYYYSGPSATGTQYFAGQQIKTNQKMYIYAFPATNQTCASQDDFNITIYPLKDLPINGGIICVDYQTGILLSPVQLDSGLNSNIYTVDWFLEGSKISTGPAYTAIKEGTYTVVSTKITPNIGDDCGYSTTTVIVEKSSPAIATVTVTDAFEDNIDIIVNLTNGFGTYEYQLDDGSFQTSNVFSDVDSGEHVITIKDIKGNCDDQILIANVLKYPKFFTPNNDGFHDTWNITDLAFQPDAVINIFDRYGKFLKQLKPSGPGWDGNYNGSPLPSSDYWFQAFYTQNGVSQIFKSHFTLKR